QVLLRAQQIFRPEWKSSSAYQGTFLFFKQCLIKIAFLPHTAKNLASVISAISINSSSFFFAIPPPFITWLPGSPDTGLSADGAIFKLTVK
ncbi:MAG: hypothetical protein OSJ58_11125, partial [Dysosmobacter sp.]|nr:hypothetical protein [Dysosmobacter sp.]